MIPVLVLFILIILTGFYGEDGVFSAILTAMIGIVFLILFISLLLDGNEIIVEKGVYEIVFIQIADREGYITETYKKDKLNGLLLNIKKEDGTIVPIHFDSQSDYIIIKDGENKLESKTKTNGNFWLTFAKVEVAKPYKIHIPQNGRIGRYKEI